MTCPKCGHLNKEGAFYCSKCGMSLEESYEDQDLGPRRVYKKSSPFTRGKARPKRTDQVQEEGPLDDGSVQPQDRAVLKQVPGKTNWAALSLTLFWGLGNRVYVCLLALVPGLNIFIALLAFYFGNSWAYRAGGYQDLKTFSRVQETWNRAGLVAFILEVMAFFFLFIYLFLPGLLSRLQPIQTLFYMLQ